MMKRFVVPTLLMVLGCASATTLLHQVRAQAAQKEHKVAICHGTASAKNPYILIIVDESAKAAHLAGHGQNSHPDFVLNNGAVLTDAQIAYYRSLDDKTACGTNSES